MKDKIDFIGIGCQKCGTTSVFNALAMHPLIMPPTKGASGRKLGINADKDKWVPKECHYWGRDVKSFGTRTYHCKYWGTLQEDLIYGEFTPNYIIFAEALEKIKEYNPNIKLIAIFRNPVERLWSEYQIVKRSGKVNKSFREFINRYSGLESPKIRQQYKKRLYPLYRSCYGRQVKQVLNLFDRKNLFFFKMEELQNFSAILEKLMLFLEIDPVPVPELKLNSRNNNKEEIPYYKELLDRFFLQEIEILEELMEWNCGDWKEQKTCLS
jgi:hypothetical protein